MAASNINLATPYNEINKLISHSEIGNLLNFDKPIGNVNIYRRAFVHKSYCTRKNENFIEGNMNCPESSLPLQEGSNERLEFLGDAVLHLIIGKYVFERYPDENEGFLTTMRSKLVNGKMLAFLSKTIGFNEYVILSQQIESNNGRSNENILEDTFESFIGAIFIDYDSTYNEGYKYAEKWIINIIEEHIDFSELMAVTINYKDKLIKHCQHVSQFIPRISELNVDTNNSKIYTICVKDNKGNIIGIGKYKIKKIAEISACKKGLEYYNIL
jgi:ribonuclease-3